MKKSVIIFLFLALCVSAAGAQSNTKKTTGKKTAKPPTAAATKSSAAAGEEQSPPKKNPRDEAAAAAPDAGTALETKTPQKKNRSNSEQTISTTPTATSAARTGPKYGYYYEFTQKDFIVRHIVIEHDENGKGKISFEKKDFDEPISDPIQLSAASLEKIKSLFQTLNFLDSTEAYQSPERNYAHLGAMKIRLAENSRERLVEFNWTENKDARALADEYRKIANQYVWQFDMSVARENQPLEAPGLMDALDSYLKRREISDPSQMIPLLKELSNDERIPLMARNRATKLIKQIEKK